MSFRNQASGQTCGWRKAKRTLPPATFPITRKTKTLWAGFGHRTFSGKRESRLNAVSREVTDEARTRDNQNLKSSALATGPALPSKLRAIRKEVRPGEAC